MEISSAAKVGMITVLATIILVMTYVFLHSVNDKVVGTPYHIIFQRVEGLTKGAPVRLAGVQVGRVFNITINERRKVDVHIDIFPEYSNVPITQESIFTIGQSFVGERWVEISPQNGTALGAEGIANGVSPVTMDEILAKSEGTLDEIDTSMEGFNKFVNDPEFQHNIKGAMAGLHNLTLSFNHTARDASRLLNGLNDKVDSMASTATTMMNTIKGDVDGLSSDFHGVAGTLNRVAHNSEGQIQGILHNVQGATASLRSSMARVDELLNNKGVREDLVASVHNLRQTTESVNNAIEDMRTLITNNPKVKANLEGSLDEAHATVTEAHKMVERLNRILGRYSGDKDPTPVNGTVPPPKPSGPNQKLLQLKLESEWNLKNGAQSTNLNTWLLPNGIGPIPYGVSVGMDSLGTQNLLNLQVGDTHNSVRGRAGVIRSQFGIGVDKYFGSNSSLSMDVYDPRNPQLDFIGRYNLPSFFVMGGVRDTLHDREPVLGVGKQF